MKNLRLELFNAKKQMTIEQEDIISIIEAHINVCDQRSEKEIIKSLNERLNDFTYDKDVKGLLESLNMDLMSHEILYTLKDLYKLVEHRNSGGTVYRQPLNVLLQIINANSDEDRMGRILNELAIYDWVPEIKTFMVNLTASPEQKQNLLNGGKSDKVYTIVESVEDGYLAFLKDSWFHLSENGVEKTLLENHVKDDMKIKSLRTLEAAIKFAEISEDRVDFKISEGLVIGISTKNSGVTFINNEATNKETTLESLFSSPIIPIINKSYYPVILEAANNIDKFVELDIVKKVTNLANPFLEAYAFNYNNSIYSYRADSRYGSSFFKYESCVELIDDYKNELNHDLTYFFENMLSKEVKVKKMLEDQERAIKIDIEDIDKNIDKVEANIKMLGESAILSKALTILTEAKKEKSDKLKAIKEVQYTEVIRK
jgi:hypothetical protein